MRWVCAGQVAKEAFKKQNPTTSTTSPANSIVAIPHDKAEGCINAANGNRLRSLTTRRISREPSN
jgi:hypothetical protein